MKKFIVFEGLDKSGKSTQIKKYKSYLEEKGYEVSLYGTWEGCPILQEFKSLITDKDRDIDKYTELFLYKAARRELFTKCIVPDIEDGKIVLVDRFTDSTLVYQGALRKISVPKLWAINNIVTDYEHPDHVFIFDISKETFLKRMNCNLDRMEAALVDNYEVASNIYRDLGLIREDTHLIKEASIEETYKEVITYSQNHLEDF